MRIYFKGLLLAYTCLLVACGQTEHKKNLEQETVDMTKPVLYQLFTRLYGNTNRANIPWGTIEQNGVGKFNDITPEALASLKALGVTHVWYTGVPHHALVKDYQAYGISNDDPDVVKGRAGSPYAVKDYYSVNPDLAVDPSQRLEEFKALIERTHAQGLQVVIDIVPNHVARHYQSTAKPAGVQDFGEGDDDSVEYARDNNFYYVPNSTFIVPHWQDGYLPLGGEAHPLVDGEFNEKPAKWTGNGSRLAQPDFHDWYETVKINYGIKPDGSYDFPELPADLYNQDYQALLAFWQGQSIPDSWKKFDQIAAYWQAMGVDGFRFDMAEMVPVEFWSYLNAGILSRNPNAFILAEIYNPKQYRAYIEGGKMSYLYDKVGLYDALKRVMRGEAPASSLLAAIADVSDIDHHMLNFLENHDEQRIASEEFAGNALKGLPAATVSALVNRAPMMLYFGQEVGEPGNENAGFGKKSRTSIFDYIGVPHHQRNMNNGKFDGGLLTAQEQQLKAHYQKILTLSRDPIVMGAFIDLHQDNVKSTAGYSEQQFSFIRTHQGKHLLVVANFSEDIAAFDLLLNKRVIHELGLADGEYILTSALTGKKISLRVNEGEGRAGILMSGLGSDALLFNN